MRTEKKKKRKKKKKKTKATHIGLSPDSQPSRASWQYAQVVLSSDSRVGVYFHPASASCFVLHFQPFLLSYGQRPANVDLRASRR